MAKLLVINGSPNEHGCTYTGLNELMKTLNELGVETELLYLGKKPMQDCMNCMWCKKNGGRCVVDDDPVNDIIARLDEFDGIVAGSPVYSGGPSGRICSFLDRLFFACPGDRFNGKLAASVVSCRRGGSSATFERLNKYWLINNMIVVGSQYWNQLHGLHAEDTLKDEEGLQTMRTLARNMAWMLESIAAGRQAGITYPQHEPRVHTHFIR